MRPSGHDLNGFALGPDDRFSLLSGLAHDPLQRDLFTPFFLGAAIAVPGRPHFVAEKKAQSVVFATDATRSGPANPLPVSP